MPGTAAATERESDGVRSARVRILGELLDQVENLASSAVSAMREEIPSYTAQDDERFFDDVLDQVTRHYQTKLSAFLEGRTVTLEDISFVRGAATRRARSGFALEDYLNAFRVGQQVLWDARWRAPATVRLAARRRCAWRARRCATWTSPPPTPRTRTWSSRSMWWRTPTASGATCSSTCWPGTCRPTDRWPARRSATGSAPETRMMVAVAVIAGQPEDSDAPDAASAAPWREPGCTRPARWWWCGSPRSWRCRRSAPGSTRWRCATAWSASSAGCARRACLSP